MENSFRECFPEDESDQVERPFSCTSSPFDNHNQTERSHSTGSSTRIFGGASRDRSFAWQVVDGRVLRVYSLRTHARLARWAFQSNKADKEVGVIQCVAEARWRGSPCLVAAVGAAGGACDLKVLNVFSAKIEKSVRMDEAVLAMCFAELSPDAESTMEIDSDVASSPHAPPHAALFTADRRGVTRVQLETGDVAGVHGWTEGEGEEEEDRGLPTCISYLKPLNCVVVGYADGSFRICCLESGEIADSIPTDLPVASFVCLRVDSTENAQNSSEVFLWSAHSSLSWISRRQSKPSVPSAHLWRVVADDGIVSLEDFGVEVALQSGKSARGNNSLVSAFAFGRPSQSEGHLADSDGGARLAAGFVTTHGAGGGNSGEFWLLEIRRNSPESPLVSCYSLDGKSDSQNGVSAWVSPASISDALNCSRLHFHLRKRRSRESIERQRNLLRRSFSFTVSCLGRSGVRHFAFRSVQRAVLAVLADRPSVCFANAPRALKYFQRAGLTDAPPSKSPDPQQALFYLLHMALSLGLSSIICRYLVEEEAQRDNEKQKDVSSLPQSIITWFECSFDNLADRHCEIPHTIDQYKGFARVLDTLSRTSSTSTSTELRAKVASYLALTRRKLLILKIKSWFEASDLTPPTDYLFKQNLSENREILKLRQFYGERDISACWRELRQRRGIDTGHPCLFVEALISEIDKSSKLSYPPEKMSEIFDILAIQNQPCDLSSPSTSTKLLPPLTLRLLVVLYFAIDLDGQNSIDRNNSVVIDRKFSAVGAKMRSLCLISGLTASQGTFMEAVWLLDRAVLYGGGEEKSHLAALAVTKLLSVISVESVKPLVLHFAARFMLTLVALGFSRAACSFARLTKTEFSDSKCASLFLHASLECGRTVEALNHTRSAPKKLRMVLLCEFVKYFCDRSKWLELCGVPFDRREGRVAESLIEEFEANGSSDRRLLFLILRQRGPDALARLPLLSGAVSERTVATLKRLAEGVPEEMRGNVENYKCLPRHNILPQRSQAEPRRTFPSGIFRPQTRISDSKMALPVDLTEQNSGTNQQIFEKDILPVDEPEPTHLKDNNISSIMLRSASPEHKSDQAISAGVLRVSGPSLSPPISGSKRRIGEIETHDLVVQDDFLRESTILRQDSLERISVRSRDPVKVPVSNPATQSNIYSENTKRPRSENEIENVPGNNQTDEVTVIEDFPQKKRIRLFPTESGDFHPAHFQENSAIFSQKQPTEDDSVLPKSTSVISNASEKFNNAFGDLGKSDRSHVSESIQQSEVVTPDGVTSLVSDNVGVTPKSPVVTHDQSGDSVVVDGSDVESDKSCEIIDVESSQDGGLYSDLDTKMYADEPTHDKGDTNVYTGDTNLFAGDTNTFTCDTNVYTDDTNLSAGDMNTFTGDTNSFTRSKNTFTGDTNVLTGDTNVFANDKNVYTGVTSEPQSDDDSDSSCMIIEDRSTQSAPPLTFRKIAEFAPNRNMFADLDGFDQSDLSEIDESCSEPENSESGSNQSESDASNQSENDVSDQSESDISGQSINDVASESDSNIVNQSGNEGTSLSNNDPISQSGVLSQPNHETSGVSGSNFEQFQQNSNPQSDNDVASQPDNDVASQSDNDVVSQPDNDVASQPDNDVVSQPDNDVASQSNNDVVSQSDNGAGSQSDNDVASQSDNDAASQSDNDVVSQSDNDVVSQSDNDVVSQPDNDVASQSDNDVASQSENDVASQSENDVASQSENDGASLSDNDVANQSDNDVASQPEQDESMFEKSGDKSETHSQQSSDSEHEVHFISSDSPVDMSDDESPFQAGESSNSFDRLSASETANEPVEMTEPLEFANESVELCENANVSVSKTVDSIIDPVEIAIEPAETAVIEQSEPVVEPVESVNMEDESDCESFNVSAESFSVSAESTSEIIQQSDEEIQLSDKSFEVDSASESVQHSDESFEVDETIKLSSEPVEPANTISDPEDFVIEPVEPPIEADNSAIEPVDSLTTPVELFAEPVELFVKPSESFIEPTESPNESFQQDSEQMFDEPTKSSVELVEEQDKSFSEPVEPSNEVTDQISESVKQSAEPINDQVESVSEFGEPTKETLEFISDQFKSANEPIDLVHEPATERVDQSVESVTVPIDLVSESATEPVYQPVGLVCEQVAQPVKAKIENEVSKSQDDDMEIDLDADLIMEAEDKSIDHDVSFVPDSEDVPSCYIENTERPSAHIVGVRDEPSPKNSGGDISQIMTESFSQGNDQPSDYVSRELFDADIKMPSGNHQLDNVLTDGIFMSPTARLVSRHSREDAMGNGTQPGDLNTMSASAPSTPLAATLLSESFLVTPARIAQRSRSHTPRSSPSTVARTSPTVNTRSANMELRSGVRVPVPGARLDVMELE
eukprot:250683_1